MPPSESAPSSESEPSSGFGSAPDYEYGTCGCIAVPITWEVVWPTMDGDAACPIPAGTYELDRVENEPPLGCTWKGGGVEHRMKPIAGVWTCDSGTRQMFRIQVDGLNVISLNVYFVSWGPSGLGTEAYGNRVVNYAAGSGIICIHNGVLSTGGSDVIWPDKTDVTIPYATITMPVPSTVTIRPKL